MDKFLIWDQTRGGTLVDRETYVSYLYHCAVLWNREYQDEQAERVRAKAREIQEGRE